MSKCCSSHKVGKKFLTSGIDYRVPRFIVFGHSVLSVFSESDFQFFSLSSFSFPLSIKSVSLRTFNNSHCLRQKFDRTVFKNT